MNLKHSTPPPPNNIKLQSFWKHEYEKHGGCFGYTRDHYFNTGMALYKGYDIINILTQNNIHRGLRYQVTAFNDAIAGAVGKNVALNCNNFQELSEVLICFDPTVQSPVDCPRHRDRCGTGDIYMP